MSKAMIVVFILDGDFDNLYVTTPENYSTVLDKHNITPDRTTFKTIPLESILLVLDNKMEYILR